MSCPERITRICRWTYTATLVRLIFVVITRAMLRAMMPIIRGATLRTMLLIAMSTILGAIILMIMRVMLRNVVMIMRAMLSAMLLMMVCTFCAMLLMMIRTFCGMLLMIMRAMLRDVAYDIVSMFYLPYAQAQTTKDDTKERFRINVTTTSKSQFVPSDRVFPLPTVSCSLYLQNRLVVSCQARA